jgi:putative transposase
MRRLAANTRGTVSADSDLLATRGAHDEHGTPRYLRSDNGPEFVAAATLRWFQEATIETALIDPGKPWQNATDESFNRKLRDECLRVQWFRNRIDARVTIEQWKTAKDNLEVKRKRQKRRTAAHRQE